MEETARGRIAPPHEAARLTWPYPTGTGAGWDEEDKPKGGVEETREDKAPRGLPSQLLSMASLATFKRRVVEMYAPIEPPDSVLSELACLCSHALHPLNKRRLKDKIRQREGQEVACLMYPVRSNVHRTTRDGRLHAVERALGVLPRPRRGGRQVYIVSLRLHISTPEG